MFTFSNTHITIATPADAAAITALLNKAYRGEDAKKGWTHEAHLIGGDTRTNESSIKELIDIPDSIIVRYSNNEQKLIGCVNLQKHGIKLYLGMLSVTPHLQGGGIGKQLLKAAEEYAQHLHSTAIYMSVISLRDELIDWYRRHGYEDTGERKTFIEDNISGRHLTQLEFMMLEKEIIA